MFIVSGDCISINTNCLVEYLAAFRQPSLLFSTMEQIIIVCSLYQKTHAG